MNKLNSPLMRQLNEECYVEFKDKVKDNLHIYSFDEGFTIEMLMSSISLFEKKGSPGYSLDLLIIDHLQYFSLTSEQNQFAEMTEILMKVKEITNHFKIPVVLVSHLRKRDKDRGLPGQDDFFGTSNISKISSQSIVIAAHPNSADDDYVNGLYPTFFRFVKSRTGLRPSLAALCKFDVKTGKYAKVYDVYRLKGDVPLKSPLANSKLPKWALRAALLKERIKLQQEGSEK